jgi:hypothetical protein
MAKKEKTEKCPPCPDCGGRSAPPASLKTVTGATDIVGQFDRGEFVFPEYGFHRQTTKQPCAYQPGKPIPPGYVELDVVADKAATKLGIPAGPTLRFCMEQGKPGPVLSVKDPHKATAVVNAYKACIIKEGRSKMECAERVIEERPVRISGAPKRRRSRR